MFKKTKTVLKL